MIAELSDQSDVVRVRRGRGFPPTLRAGSRWQVIRAVPVMGKQDKLLWTNYHLINIKTGKRISVSEEVFLKSFTNSGRIVRDRRFVRLVNVRAAA